MTEWIFSTEAAHILGVAHGTLNKMASVNRIPVTRSRQLNKETNRVTLVYDKAEFLTWVASNPIRHPGFKDPEKRRQRHQYVKPEFKTNDIYGIQRGTKPFVYSGYVLMAILFCQPGLRNGRHSYEDCINEKQI
jgi:hypothetical protein